MTDESNEAGFSEQERCTLAAVLDEIVPPSGDGRLPGAGALGLAGYIDEALRKTPELRPMIAQGLADLDQQAGARGARDFAALPRAERVELLSQQALVLPLTFHAYAGYYQHPRVAAALGLESRPPHPKGYEMEPNDLGLLDAVRQRRKMYREG